MYSHNIIAIKVHNIELLEHEMVKQKVRDIYQNDESYYAMRV